MPGKVGVKIKAGRNLPVMDRSSDTTDAYVEIKLGNVTHKTDVCRKSLNPQWNTDWFRFEVDDAELQDEPLQIRLMDYDTYSANDAIGKVNISLNPLCLEMSGPTTHGKGTVLSGWIPVFDTMHGIRGEVNVIVKVDLFSDLNKFRQSSCGIPFFHSQCIPYGYRAQIIHGFVEELVVNDDPEYQWIDKIRTPRASNEARQVVFLKLSGQVQRKMGLKAINMGANAVIGYTQCFDLEGDVGVVARGIGTAVTLIKDTTSSQSAAATADNALIEESLNEINAAAVASNNALVAAAAAASSGITDSPSLKRFTSPAQAAVVAAAAAMPTANALSSGPSSAALMLGSSSSNSSGGGRAKLSPSSSKLALNASATTTAASNATTVASNAVTVAAGTSPATAAVDRATATSVTNSIPAAAVASKEVPTEMCRRSSDSDLSVTPKGNSLCVASERLVAATAMMRLSQSLGGKNANTDGMEGMLEYPFLTMTKYPPGFILHLGATVAARSVKLLERVPNPDEPEVRDSWWTELRMEIRSHARALGCNVVLGYSEATTISDDVCVLSATGTAAVINMAYNRSVSQTDILPTVVKPVGIGIGLSNTGVVMSASLEERETLKDLRNGMANDAAASIAVKDSTMSSSLGAATHSSVGKKNMLPPSMNLVKNSACSVCHVPYNLASVPFNVKMKKCAICRKGRVPDVLLATLEVPEHLHVTGRGCFMQAQVVRAKKDLRSELNAKEISDGLPFLEYELHRVLINKLKAKGMNAIFGLRAQVAIGERMIALIATGTALFLTALPVPQVPKIVAGNTWTDKQKLNELQKKLQETFERNQEIYQLKCIDPDLISSSGATLDKQSDTDESDDEVIEIDLNCGNKDTCVLEVDDIEDLEIISLLMETYPPEGFHVVNTQSVPGMLDMEAVKNLQMFTQVWRAKLDVSQNISGFPKHFQRLLQTIYFKLRTMIPCAICDLRFRLDLPESDQIQLLVTGMALGLGDANKFKYRRKAAATGITNGTTADVPDTNGLSVGNKRTLQEEDYIFPLDEDQMVETPTPTSNLPPYGLNSFKLSKTSPSRQQSKKGSAINRNYYFPLRDRYGVDITPLSFIPGGRIDKYLGNLNFFFIRETTSIRETGGISGFVHSFITELLAVVRAHISALGGNAMVSFYMSELILVDNQHKNQGQCLISIGGDAVYVSYHADD
ncbi:C2 domain-containing protein 5 isoform X2 [Anastrepha obliqua]|uniref:C2 domain-containing protein 5 isoform X2 n=1 Tax=Anastrepha obliqua TaxID=95512 RepID=UPI002409019D|nr:C2 domain-containing protein 5 isoform X2 [Anastrepha obliqua]